MNLNAKSWKTTSAGIIMIIAGVVRLIFAIKASNITEESIMTSVSSVIGGLGLLFAKDSNVTGGTDVSAKNDPVAVQQSNLPK